MLAATCEQYSFCMRVAPGGGTPSPIQQRGPCISNHPTIDYSVACQALESTCEQHNFCKRNHAHETKKHPKPVNDGAEPESEGEATPEVEAEIEAESESEAEDESESESKAEAEAESKAEAEAEAESESEAELEPESKAEAEAGAEPESEAEAEPESNAEVEPESEAEAEAEAASESEAEAEPEPESKAEPEAESESEEKSGVQPMQCVPIGNCDSYTWCNQDTYHAWCRDAGKLGTCPAPFCKTSAELVQRHARKHLRSAKRHAIQTSANVLLQVSPDSRVVDRTRVSDDRCDF